MKIKKFLHSFNDFSIATKILAGFAMVFLIFFSLSFVFYKNMTTDKKNLEKISHLSVNTVKILNINREISEIQRLTSVYSLTGGASVIEKIRSSYKNLKSVLTEVHETTDSPSQKELVNSLTRVLTSYGQNIDSLEERYTYRDRLIQEKLPNLRQKGIALFKQKIDKLRAQKKFEMASIHQSMLEHWHIANTNAFNFINKKDYKYRVIVEQNLLALEKVLNAHSEFKPFEVKVYQLIVDFNETFDQAVQANRIYLSLVNVVMAGSALEFTTVSNQLRETGLLELRVLIEKNKQNFHVNQRVIFTFISFSLPFLIMIGFYYQVNIANSIRNLSSTFQKFIEGDLDHKISELNRNDEIGRLATAASAFRDVSKKMKAEQDRAERLSESKSRFLATMSHEIRTPMNAVLSCTHLLLDAVKNKEHVNLLQTIQTSGDALLILINDILDFSKIESGKMTLENEDFNLHETLDNVIELLSSNARQNNVQLNLKIQHNVPVWIKSDVTRLRQVLVNLVGNAIKFTSNEVTLECSIVKSNEDKLLFTITDNGIGIEKEAQDRLFKEFSQVDASTTRKFGGTGLGLAICKGIVGSLGGKIWVESEKNSGAKFSFTMVLEAVSKEISVNKKVMPAETNPEMGESFPLRILMAEDNTINQMVAKKMIAKLGYRIDVVANGLEAVEAVRNKTFDLIFMDQHMPEMDGLEATKQIRKLFEKQPKIYALTAGAYKEDKERCLNAGMDGFLTKPIVFDDIVSAIQETISSTQPSKEPGTSVATDSETLNQKRVS